MSLALSKPESSVLAVCEEIIERGMTSFTEVGNAMLRIRNERLYRAGFATFQEYCEAKWQMSDRHAHRLIDAAEIAGNLKTDQMSVLPAGESQVRPLKDLEPDQQRKAWQQATDTAKKPGKPTAEEVKLVVEQITNPKKERKTYLLKKESPPDSFWVHKEERRSARCCGECIEAREVA